MSIQYKKLGRNIRSIRKERKITQKDLSEILDCSPEHMCQIENGNRPIQLEMLNRLCEALNVSYNDILHGATDAHIGEAISRPNLSGEYVSEFADIVSGCSDERIQAILVVCRHLADMPK